MSEDDWWLFTSKSPAASPRTCLCAGVTEATAASGNSPVFSPAETAYVQGGGIMRSVASVREVERYADLLVASLERSDRP